MDELSSGASVVVKVAAQLAHCLRRQMWLTLFFGRELITCVSEPQYIHTMATYCHAAIKNASV